jgi:hypothetical protein
MSQPLPSWVPSCSCGLLPLPVQHLIPAYSLAMGLPTAREIELETLLRQKDAEVSDLTVSFAAYCSITKVPMHPLGRSYQAAPISFNATWTFYYRPYHTTACFDFCPSPSYQQCNEGTSFNLDKLHCDDRTYTTGQTFARGK